MPLPAGFADADIGSVGSAGSCTEAGFVWTQTGAGADIDSLHDQFNYCYVATLDMSIDHQLIVRVVSQSNTDAFSKVGIMMRNELPNDSQHAFMSLTPAQGSGMGRRPIKTGSTTFDFHAAVAAPYWLRLSWTAAGATFTGEDSSDGVSWNLVKAIGFSFTNTTGVLAGLATCSHADPTLSTAVFDNFKIDGVLQGTSASAAPYRFLIA